MEKVMGDTSRPPENPGIGVEVDCPVCAGDEILDSFRLKDRLAENSPVYQLYICTSCGLLFLDPAISSKQISESYPEGYWWRESGRFSSLEKVYRRTVLRLDQIQFLTRIFPEPNGMSLLDVGCGNGLFVRQARQKGFDAFGLEASPEAVEIAKSDGIETIICGSVDQLEKSTRKFDLMTLFHCLEHLDDPVDYLRRLSRSLKSPGHLILQVPNKGSIQADLFGSKWYGLDCPRHLCNFDEKSLTILLEKSGFRVETVRHFSLRDNAAAFVSSLFPGLDPMAVKIKNLNKTGKRNNLAGNLKELIYLGFFLLGQPFALFEALMKKGATLTVYARRMI